MKCFLALLKNATYLNLTGLCECVLVVSGSKVNSILVPPCKEVKAVKKKHTNKPDKPIQKPKSQ